MTDEAATAALKGAAEALHQSAQTHKSLEFQHRKQARRLRRQLAQLEAECTRRGIQIEIDTAKEAQS